MVDLSATYQTTSEAVLAQKQEWLQKSTEEALRQLAKQEITQTQFTEIRGKLESEYQTWYKKYTTNIRYRKSENRRVIDEQNRSISEGALSSVEDVLRAQSEGRISADRARTLVDQIEEKAQGLYSVGEKGGLVREGVLPTYVSRYEVVKKPVDKAPEPMGQPHVMGVQRESEYLQSQAYQEFIKSPEGQRVLHRQREYAFQEVEDKRQLYHKVFFGDVEDPLGVIKESLGRTKATLEVMSLPVASALMLDAVMGTPSDKARELQSAFKDKSGEAKAEGLFLETVGLSTTSRLLGIGASAYDFATFKIRPGLWITTGLGLTGLATSPKVRARFAQQVMADPLQFGLEMYGGYKGAQLLTKGAGYAASKSYEGLKTLKQKTVYAKDLIISGLREDFPALNEIMSASQISPDFITPRAYDPTSSPYLTSIYKGINRIKQSQLLQELKTSPDFISPDPFQPGSPSGIIETGKQYLKLQSDFISPRPYEPSTPSDLFAEFRQFLKLRTDYVKASPYTPKTSMGILGEFKQFLKIKSDFISPTDHIPRQSASLFDLRQTLKTSPDFISPSAAKRTYNLFIKPVESKTTKGLDWLFKEGKGKASNILIAPATRGGVKLEVGEMTSFPDPVQYGSGVAYLDLVLGTDFQGEAPPVERSGPPGAFVTYVHKQDGWAKLAGGAYFTTPSMDRDPLKSESKLMVKTKQGVDIISKESPFVSDFPLDDTVSDKKSKLGDRTRIDLTYRDAMAQDVGVKLAQSPIPITRQKQKQTLKIAPILGDSPSSSPRIQTRQRRTKTRRRRVGGPLIGFESRSYKYRTPKELLGSNKVKNPLGGKKKKMKGVKLF